MKLVILEPLGVEKDTLLSMARTHFQNAKSPIEIVAYDTRVEDTPTLIERSKDADMVMLSNFPYGKEVMSACPNLKMICVAFTGVDHIDMEYCKEHGILVSNCSGYATVAVTELVFGMLLTLYRNLISCNQVVREGGTKDGLVGMELAGKKFGVIGVGAIGSSVAKVAHAFGCEVYTYGGSRATQLEFAKHVSLEELLRECDIVSLHTPLNESTRGMINKERLSLMKSSAVLINTSRGPVVDSTALAQALKDGVIAGAAVDVFDTEPPLPLNDPLLHAPNTVLSPHVAFATKESMVKRAEIALENIVQWVNGTPQNVMK